MSVYLKATHDSRFPHYHLLGVRLNALTKKDLNDVVSENIDKGCQVVVANQNLHSLYVLQQERRMRDFYSLATYTHVDGMSLILLARLLGFPLGREHRTGYMDWLPSLLQLAAERQWLIYFLSGTQEVLDIALAKMRREWPGIRVRGHSGYFDKRPDSEENLAILAEINEIGPNILMVGMGMPEQERWIADNYPNIQAQVILHCGGMLNFYAGKVSTPPRWLGRIGLEWFYRLCSEPARLWKRYLLEPILLLEMLALGKLKQVAYEDEK